MRRFLTRATGVLLVAAICGFLALAVRSCLSVDRHGRPLDDIWQPRYCPHCGRRMTVFEFDGRTEFRCLKCQPLEDTWKPARHDEEDPRRASDDAESPK